MVFIFDLDGTLANIEHRLHFIGATPTTFVKEEESPKKDWDSFFAAAANDEPIFEVITVARALAKAGHTLIYSTGRAESSRLITAKWLEKYRIPIGLLYMRKTGDHREDNVVKGELFDQILKIYKQEEIGGVFEDREQVVQMYRARGVRVFQVAPGKF
jgi:phosphoglycolate phosphatase-like HAD superfamily hydrolase